MTEFNMKPLFDQRRKVRNGTFVVFERTDTVASKFTHFVSSKPINRRQVKTYIEEALESVHWLSPSYLIRVRMKN